MTFIETIRNRRSIRKFTDADISQDDISLLKEALLRSPSSRNLNPWKFYFVQNKTLLQELSFCKTSGSALLSQAKLAVVVCGDENISDVWVEDCSISSIILQLTLQSLGLGSCWVQIRNRFHSDEISSQDFVRKLLNIEKNLQVESIIAIGHSAEKRSPLEYSQLQFDKIKDILS